MTMSIYLDILGKYTWSSGFLFIRSSEAGLFKNLKSQTGS